jgi:hypothetical protein
MTLKAQNTPFKTLLEHFGRDYRPKRFKRLILAYSVNFLLKLKNQLILNMSYCFLTSMIVTFDRYLEKAEEKYFYSLLP